MKIAINLDGVLIDKTQYQYKNGLKYFGRNLRYVNECAYSFKNMFNCTNDEEVDFWNKYRLNYYLSVKPCDNSVECLKKLKEDGHEIYLVTNRKFLNEHNLKSSIYRYLLNCWLARNKIVYDGIVYCSNEFSLEEKISLCMDNELDYIVEDTVPCSIVLSKICNVLLYNRPYNSGYSYVERINSFDDIVSIVNGKGKVKK